ncbi:MAG: primosomal protein N' [Candidatus Magasanikbacteria bacterium CG10_big_fil_rev_8_21_14_0_10_43_6]|uniref:Primosomal protein N n=1 Tax=Candidatus Magasanikbacteria bacterium CG10_big_fil_rev_8_21_14_0_10_43_6 TaxID=1974650 RepID=A0A2M6W1K1_9BACT|nr:MAG: primosomal protein N' [Candidatus Magasanikbacteria bacterium CG10_big_fil_rev_8_21_14_0_10_43_6]
MIATVIPIVRLPKHLGYFDYAMSKELVPLLRIGQLVSIPFRNSEHYGIVFSIQKKATPTEKEKELTSIVHEIPLVDANHLTLIAFMSTLYGVSPCTLLKMSLLPIQKSKIKKMHLEELPKKPSLTTATTSLHTYHTPQQQSETIQHLLQQSSASGQTLILVPEVHAIDETRSALTISQQEDTVVWHSTLTVKQKFERWLHIRNGEKHIVIGTRGSLLLPFFDLQRIIITEEHSDQHKHWDQAPRFHVKDICTLKKKPTHLLSYSPSIESYFLAYKKDIPHHKASEAHLQEPPTVIDLRSERAAHNYSCFSLSLEDRIREAEGDVFLFLNRRGFATSLGCQTCGFMNTCNTCALPTIYDQTKNILVCHYCKQQQSPVMTCPSCKDGMVRLRGVGTQLVESSLRTLLGEHHPHAVVRIDADIEDISYLPRQRPRMIVGTGKALSHIRWDRTDLIIFVDIDRQLAIPEYMATESVWHTMQQVQFRRLQSSTFYIQTRNPDHNFFQSLGDPDRLYREELHTRHRLAYPPYSYLVKYFFGHANQTAAADEAERVYELLCMALTKEKKPIRLHPPIAMHPFYYRKKYWYAILVKITPAEWQEHLQWVNTYIPPLWKIDPRPISILSP